MKAISIKQPWASLIAHGIKKYRKTIVDLKNIHKFEKKLVI